VIANLASAIAPHPALRATFSPRRGEKERGFRPPLAHSARALTGARGSGSQARRICPSMRGEETARSRVV